jgi:hypothetical protein
MSSGQEVAQHGDGHAPNGSDPVYVCYPVKIGLDDEDVGSGFTYRWTLPSDLEDVVLFGVEAFLTTPGAGSSEVMVRSVRRSIDLLTVPATILAGDYSSIENPTQPVVDGALPDENNRLPLAECLEVELVTSGGGLGFGVHLFLGNRLFTD